MGDLLLLLIPKALGDSLRVNRREVRVPGQVIGALLSITDITKETSQQAPWEALFRALLPPLSWTLAP